MQEEGNKCDDKPPDKIVNRHTEIGTAVDPDPLAVCHSERICIQIKRCDQERRYCSGEEYMAGAVAAWNRRLIQQQIADIPRDIEQNHPRTDQSNRNHISSFGPIIEVK